MEGGKKEGKKEMKEGRKEGRERKKQRLLVTDILLLYEQTYMQNFGKRKACTQIKTLCIYETFCLLL